MHVNGQTDSAPSDRVAQIDQSLAACAAETIAPGATWSRSARVAAARILRAVDTLGLLCLLAVGALLGGAVIQGLRHELPGAYSWLEPFSTLKLIARSSWVPACAMASYGLGALATRGPPDWRSWVGRARGLPRQRALTLGLVALAVFGADVLYVPQHGALDALALSIAGVLLVRRWPRAVVIDAAVNLALVTLLFTGVCYWFTVVKALTFAAGAPRDALILQLESTVFGVAPHRVIAAWTRLQPEWLYWFDRAYFRIFEHMLMVTCFLFGLGDRVRRAEYVGSLALCYVIGAPLYLTFPALGPAYFDPEAFTFLRQRQDLITPFMQAKLWQNTTAIARGRSTLLETWSYIACMPSLHIAHEVVMLYHARGSTPALLLSIGFTGFTCVAVVALGWHYPTDLILGAALGLLAIAIARWQSQRLLPRHARAGSTSRS